METEELDYVHVKCVNGERLECTCETFSIMESTVKTKLSSELVSGWAGVSCCHVRFMSEILSGTKMADSEGLTKGVLMLKSKSDVDKYSISTSSDVEFVTVFTVKDTTRKVITCHSSFCQHKQGKTRAISSLHNATDICEHIVAYRNWLSDDTDMAYLLSFGEHIVPDENNHENKTEDDLVEDDINERLLPQTIWKNIFDEATGLWTFHKDCISKAAVENDKSSPLLKKNLRERFSIIPIEEVDYILVADPIGETCKCGAGWTSDDCINGTFQTGNCVNVYSTMGCKHNVQTFDRRCMSGNCISKYDGKENSLFISTVTTACGYEIGWEYISQVMTSRQTFTGFCKTMDDRYEMAGCDKKFLSPKAFIKWWFAWASSLNIDFRQKCQMCDGRIEHLACDGTKIGMGVSSAFVIPMEEANNSEDKIHSHTRRYDRTFITNQDCGTAKERAIITSHLKYLCNFILGKIKGDDILQDSICYSNNTRLVQAFPESCRVFLQLFIQGGMQREEQQSLAKFFFLLTGDCSIDVILPYVLITPTKHYIGIYKSNKDVTLETQEIIDMLKSYCPELAELISVSNIINGKPTFDVINLLEVITTKVKALYLNKIAAGNATQIPNSYNPPKYGRAYYFSDSGNQLRTPRIFTCDDGSTTNFDDKPSDACQKSFNQQVSKKGITYLFLWFCPLHGHCYGFHIIPGSEGRKDPASSLYCYMEEAPKTVFYDFACSLSEYTQNRESGFYNNTRFFHDIFHGYSHKCSSAFKSNRLNGFKGFNTSICEQFNSFLQCIKASSRLMTQEHFTFYTQFFISIWNESKHRSFKNKLHIALAGNK